MPFRTAACACGQLRAVCGGDPMRVALCNCTQCQRRTGSAFGVNCYFPRTQVRMEGEAKRFTRSSDATREVHISFCPTCGSTVFWDLPMRPEVVGIAVGAFADPDFPAPHAVAWAENKHHWVLLPEGVPVYPKQP